MQSATIPDINSGPVLRDVPLTSLWAKRLQFVLDQIYTEQTSRSSVIKLAVVVITAHPQTWSRILWFSDCSSLSKDLYEDLPPSFLGNSTWAKGRGLMLWNYAHIPCCTYPSRFCSDWSLSVENDTWGFSLMVNNVWRGGPLPLLTEPSSCSAVGLAGTPVSLTAWTVRASWFTSKGGTGMKPQEAV